MLSGTIITAVLMLAVLIVIFLYVDNQNKNKVKQQKAALLEQLNTVKSRYKVDVARLVEELNLPVEVRSKLIMIGNNYFVYQAINESTVSGLTYNLDKLSRLFSALQEDFERSGEDSCAIDKIDGFVEQLPKSTRGFNSAFYNTNLTIISQLLTITPPTEETEPLEKVETQDELEVA